MAEYCEMFLEKILGILVEFLQHPEHSARMAAAKTTDFLAESDKLKGSILSDIRIEGRSPSPEGSSSLSVEINSFFYKLTTL